MALVNGPLFSLSASGQLGEALVYSSWKGIAYVRTYVVPANPRSLAQRVTRAVMKFISEQWASIDAADQASWATLAAQGGYSEFNAYGSNNVGRIADSNTPSKNSARAATLPVETVSALTNTGGVGRIDGTFNLDFVETNTWGVIIFCKSGQTNPTGVLSEITLMVPSNGTTTVAFEITDLDADDYSLAGATFSDDGLLSTAITTTTYTSVT